MVSLEFEEEETLCYMMLELSPREDIGKEEQKRRRLARGRGRRGTLLKSKTEVGIQIIEGAC
ncbi:hypothetical protein KY285_020674 [Solanum tuberosum]|nr:hypothetical protein KY285_020674 [Solanum tuberosum]